MGRMKKLLNKSLVQFFVYATIVLGCSAPLFYYVMEFFYMKDLDELILFRSDEFIEDRLLSFFPDGIELWNQYNEDLQIILYSANCPLDKCVQVPFYNKAEGHDVDYRVLYRKIELEGEPYLLVSRIPMIEPKDLTRTLVSIYSLFFFLLLISFTIFQKFVSKRLWRPFYDSLQKIESFHLDEGNVPVFKKNDIAEFTRLNRLLANLIANNVQVYTRQKQFIENASHELQTPLAVFQSQLDMLLQQPDITENQMNIIQSLYSVSFRLTRLNKNLLMLAKIDNSQFREMEEIDFTGMLKALIDGVGFLAESNKITISLTLEAGMLFIANKTLLESLVTNLLVNAIRHNYRDGDVWITGTKDYLLIRNTGKKMELDRQKIFQRFNRNTEERKGNGLGLSIVYQICKFHGWKIEYDYVEEMHQFTCFFHVSGS